MDTNTQAASSTGALPSISSIYNNVQAPTTSDLGGSLGDKATSLSSDSNGAFTNYQNEANAMPNIATTYQNLEAQNGIPQLKATSNNLQGSVNNLENSIYRVTPNVSNNTANSLTTDSQRQGMIAAQELPMQMALTPQANDLAAVNNDISTAQTGVNAQVDAQNTQNTNMLGVGQEGVTVAQANQAMQMSGFTQDEANQLQGLLQKMQITGDMDAADWTTLSTLSENYQKYQQSLGTITAQSQVTNTPIGQYGSVSYDANGKPLYSGGTPGLGSSNGGYSIVP